MKVHDRSVHQPAGPFGRGRAASPSLLKQSYANPPEPERRVDAGTPTRIAFIGLKTRPCLNQVLQCRFEPKASPRQRLSPIAPSSGRCARCWEPETTVRDRTTLEGLTPFARASVLRRSYVADSLCDCERPGLRVFATLFQTVRNSLILKRRDVLPLRVLRPPTDYDERSRTWVTRETRIVSGNECPRRRRASD